MPKQIQVYYTGFSRVTGIMKLSAGRASRLCVCECVRERLAEISGFNTMDSAHPRGQRRALSSPPQARDKSALNDARGVFQSLH